MRISLNLVIENIRGNVKIVEILNKNVSPETKLISPIILNVLADLPLIQVLYLFFRSLQL